MALEVIGTASGKLLWDQCRKQLIEKTFGEIKKKWEEFKWEDAEILYLLNLREQHSITRLLGYPKPIKIDDTFTDVYVFDKPSALKRFGIESLESLARNKDLLNPDQGKINVLKLIAKEERLFILGKPGAGKTTLLKYLTLCACDGKIDKTPIFISLKEWDDSDLELMPFLVQQFDVCSFPDVQAFIESLLLSNNALVMFDGLDEVNQEGYRRARMIRRLNSFAKKYKGAQICVTCRIAATDYSFSQFTYVEIADFNQRQVLNFVKKWYQDNPRKMERFLAELDKPENAGLMELTKTPLLLALLCLAFDEIGHFPLRKVDLYKEALDAWLRKWDSSRNIQRDEIYKNLSPTRREQMLARIAALNFEKGAYLIKKETLASQIDQYIDSLITEDDRGNRNGEEILKAIEAQHGILVERAYGLFSFSHTTFQEFLTARYICENAMGGTINRLAEKYLLDDRWHEVFLITASLLDDAELFFEAAIKRLWNYVSTNAKCVDLITWVTSRSIEIKDDQPIIRICLTYRIVDMLFERYLGALASIGEMHMDADSHLDRESYEPKELDRLASETALLGDNVEILHSEVISLMFEMDKYKSNRVIDILTKHNLDSIQIKPFNLNKEEVVILYQYIKSMHLIFECLSLSALSNRRLIEHKLLRSP
jgi:predicted NACHT family NTPase